MKTIHFKFIFFLSFLFLMLFSSCQEEAVEITEPDNEETIAPNSSLANLMRNVASNDGSIDNIIDYANCLEVVLPVTVTANGVTITIESITDFNALETLLDAFTNDDDQVEITFPITVILNDYSELVINNQTELEAQIENCNDEDEADDDIECIDFQFPITISVYNTDFQVVDTVTIDDDEALYHFIENLEGGVLASINFPVTMVLANGDTIVVENNAEMEAAIETAEDDCDEDDDYDWNDDDDEDCDVNLAEIESYLLACNIEAHTYDTSGNIIDENYLMFNANGEVVVNGEPAVTEVGTWALAESNSGYTLTITGLVTFQIVNGSWLLQGCDEDEFIFSQETNSGNVITMELEQDCNSNSSDCEDDDVNEYLSYCTWKVVSFEGNNDLINYNLEFSDSNEIVITDTDTNNTYSGYWNVVETQTGVSLELANISGPNIQAISGNWNLVVCDSQRLEFTSASGNVMIFEQNNCYTEEDLFDAITECSWQVHSFTSNGNDLTANYSDVLLTFFENEFVISEYGSTVINYGGLEPGVTGSEELIVLFTMSGSSSGIGGYYIMNSISDEEIIFTSQDTVELVLHRTCNNNNQDADTQQIKNWLYEGDWELTYSTMNSQDNSTDYDGIVFDFQDNATLLGDNGSWIGNLQYEVLRDQTGDLRFVINYLGQFPYWQMDDDWYITEVAENRIELHHVNDNSNNEFVLVFEKI